MTKQRAKMNRTITLTDSEREILRQQLLRMPIDPGIDLLNRIICADLFEAVHCIPRESVDLLFVDPPYNLNKKFHNNSFTKMELDQYTQWMDSWFKLLLPTLKPKASVYVCGDWRSSPAIYEVLSSYLYVHNRITWEREKGRGSSKNWKNASEDIWFATVSRDYYFNVEAVKLKRRVIAPYRDADGKPKDWNESREGNFRLTYPSNLWTDLTVPFWSMPENTDHPTQKPEKLLAKVILASTRPQDVVFDPFLGSGTTAVVAKKLGRNFYGIELEEEYCCLAAKRLLMAEQDPSIQGYSDGVFWERNTFREQR
ncbi:MAG TPA: DNA methyltransferase [Syntrophomonadaceae bacterium]|nr:DNA methyltransferase [Syntrophomonadaceae bacterium]HPU49681.1 DNA methyltransferase [Syntrophomonadaceae bacterium]